MRYPEERDVLSYCSDCGWYRNITIIYSLLENRYHAIDQYGHEWPLFMRIKNDKTI